MKRTNLWLSVAAGLVIGAVACQGLAADVAAGGKINILIIDGQHNHKWQETTPAIKDMLLKSGRFNVDVLTTPDAKAAKEAWADFKPEFTKYGAVLMNYHGTEWSDEVKKSFEQYVANGGGLVFYHAAVFAFAKWEQWNKMMGMGWRQANYGDRLTVDDAGKVVRTPKGEGPGSGHGPAHAFEMVVRDAQHPVMQGLPAKWMHVKDELYHGMRGPAQDMQILATAFSDPKGKGSGANEPIIWTVPAGKGRVFVTLLGHDVPATTAPGAVAVLLRGCEWAATGKVTLPAPKDISSAAPAAPAAPAAK